MVSEAWKSLPADEREYWEEMARKDKERYEFEKSNYKGPWKVPAEKPVKDPNAPKRPMSAFLSYSNSKRSAVKKLNPHMTNAEVSRILAKMWKTATDDDKSEFVQNEFKARQRYRLAMVDWKAGADDRKEAQRQREIREQNNTTVPDTAESEQQLSSLAGFLNVAQDDEVDAGASLDTWGNMPTADYALSENINFSSKSFFDTGTAPQTTVVDAITSHWDHHAASSQHGAYPPPPQQPHYGDSRSHHYYGAAPYNYQSGYRYHPYHPQPVAEEYHPYRNVFDPSY